MHCVLFLTHWPRISEKSVTVNQSRKFGVWPFMDQWIFTTFWSRSPARAHSLQRVNGFGTLLTWLTWPVRSKAANFKYLYIMQLFVMSFAPSAAFWRGLKPINIILSRINNSTSRKLTKSIGKNWNFLANTSRLVLGAVPLLFFAFTIHVDVDPRAKKKQHILKANSIIFLSRFWPALPSDHSHRRFLFFLLPPHKHKYIQKPTEKKAYDFLSKLDSLELVQFTRHWADFVGNFFV